MQPPEERRATRRLARALLWPLRRFFDPRFQGLSEQIGVGQQDVAQRLDATRAEVLANLEQTQTAFRDTQTAFRQTEQALLNSITDLRRLIEADIEANSELATLVGRSLADLLGEAERLRERIEALEPEATTPSRD